MKRHNLPLAPPKLQAQFFKKRAAVDIELPASVLTKRHNLPLAPPKLQAQFFKKWAAVNIELPAGTGGGQDAKKRKAGKPVMNESLNSTWKIPKQQLSVVLHKVHGMPMLGGGGESAHLPEVSHGQ
jgi:hypothetical protein